MIQTPRFRLLPAHFAWLEAEKARVAFEGRLGVAGPEGPPPDLYG